MAKKIILDMEKWEDAVNLLQFVVEQMKLGNGAKTSFVRLINACIDSLEIGPGDIIEDSE